MASSWKKGEFAHRHGARVFGLAATYVGTVVGAGFASGQEIWTFFARFGRPGYLGMVLAGAIFAWAGLRALALGRRLGPTATQRQVLEATVGGWAPFFDLVFLFFLLVLTGVMLAGAGALAQVYGRPAWQGKLLPALLALLVIAAGLPGLMIVNEIFVPFLVIITIIVTLKSLHLPPAYAGGKIFSSWAWPWAALLYASYNTTLALPVLVRLGAEEPEASLRRAGGLGGALGLTILGACLAATLLRQGRFVASSELPMPALAARLGGCFGLAYNGLLWAELFTTLVADLYTVAARLQQLAGGRPIFWAAATMVVGTFLARFGFARLVRTAYPAFGLLCFFPLLGLGKAHKTSYVKFR
ncbi:MAG: hypothetical protein GX493_06415 [Firmicutes bacterium]|nr:hypothetical protein [Bacillota bacterium]